MIRPITSEDMPVLIALLEATELLPPEGVEEVSAMLTSYLNGSADNGQLWLTDDEGGALMSIVYCGPEQMADGTWNLWLIAVRPDCQGQGRGTGLVRHIEETLTARGERLLLVETSGTTEFERTRAFYRKCGYDEEARIRDFYSAGDDKIVFRKVLYRN